MRVFKEYPKDMKCPICKTNENKECVLAGIEGTQEGHNIQAQAVHLNCIDLTYLEKDKGNKRNLLYMVWG